MTTTYNIHSTYIEMVTFSSRGLSDASNINHESTIVSDSNDNMIFILTSIKRDFLFYLAEHSKSNFSRYTNLLFALDNLINIVRTSNVLHLHVIKLLVILLSFLNRYTFNNFEFQIFRNHE